MIYSRIDPLIKYSETTLISAQDYGYEGQIINISTENDCKFTIAIGPKDTTYKSKDIIFIEFI